MEECTYKFCRWVVEGKLAGILMKLTGAKVNLLISFSDGTFF